VPFLFIKLIDLLLVAPPGALISTTPHPKGNIMIKLIIQSIRQTIVWTVVCGVLYPLAITAIAQLAFHDQANGSLVERDGKLVGSELLAQQFTGAKYFWPRPSAATYGTGRRGSQASSGSNLGPTSAQLQTNVRNNAKALRDAHKLAADAPVPADLVYASASGLDPHISPERRASRSPASPRRAA
jgi:K+-transporting ATPase ATPase C chain